MGYRHEVTVTTTYKGVVISVYDYNGRVKELEIEKEMIDGLIEQLKEKIGEWME